MGSLAGKRVLVVEDEPILAMSMQDMLTDLGCAVVGPALSVKEAEAMAREALLDVALLDINMGDGPSFPIARILIARSVPCCFASGYGPAGVPAELRAVPVLSKPFTVRSLAAILHGLVELASPPDDGG